MKAGEWAGVALGLGLAAALAAVSYALSAAAGPPFGALLIALLLGALVSTASTFPASWHGGFALASKTLLRWSVVLMGTQITVADVADLGWGPAIAILVPMLATFGATLLIGRGLMSDLPLIVLLATGSSICGASAILATSTVVNARSEHIACALAIITVLGTAGMILAPFAGYAFGLGDKQYGLWVGASLHEVAQVVGAGFEQGSSSAKWAVVSKLLRVACLAPMLLILAIVAGRARGGGAPLHRAILPPWYVGGFVLVLLFNSMIGFPTEAVRLLALVLPMLLCATLAAIGLETSLRRMAALGWRPLIVGVCAALTTIAGLSLCTIMLLVDAR